MQPFESPIVPTVPQAVDIFEQHCVPRAPIIGERRLEAEHHSLQYDWGGRHLSTGSLPEITGVLRRNLDRDTTRPGFRGIRIAVHPDQHCLHALSFVADNRAIAYRIWRTPERYALFGSRFDTLT